MKPARQRLGRMALAVAAAIAGPAAAQERTIQLSEAGAGEPGFRIDGIAASDGLGYSVGPAGDVNGDGFDDVIVGAWQADPLGRANAGAAYVVFGAASVPAVDTSTLEAEGAGFAIHGAQAGDLAGHGVGGGHDLNGDGLADLVIGAVSADRAGTDIGEAYVVFGKADAAAVDLATLQADGRGFVIRGVAGERFAGRKVAIVGDMNGDGLGEALVGANGAGTCTPFCTGAAHLVFGKADTDPVELGSLGAGGFRIDGVAPGDEAGFEVAPAGDANGDGRADLLVTAGRADAGGVLDAGAAYVIFGKADPSDVLLADIDGGSGFRIEGIDTSDLLSRAGAAGDFDGDGLDDVIVGAPFADPQSRTDAGEAYVVFGKQDSLAVDLAAPGPAAIRIEGVAGLAGWAVGGGVDFNADGFDDVVVAAVNDTPGGRSGAGRVHVIFGSPDPRDVDLAALGTAGVTLDGVDPGDQAGRHVAGAGDVDGDGVGDVIVGAWRGDPGGAVDAGEAYVVQGREIPFELSVPTPAGLGAGDRLGGAVATDGNLFAVGLPAADIGNADSGRVVVYRSEGAALVEDAVIDVPAGFAARGFGGALAMEGNQLVIGAPGDPPPTAKGPGGSQPLQAALFERLSAGDWRIKSTLSPRNGNAGDAFGAAVAIEGDLILVGAPGDADGVDSGAVHVFEIDNQTTLLPTDKLKPGNLDAGAAFGAAVSLKRGRAAVGAPGSPAAAAVSGSVHLYEVLAGNLMDQGAVTGSGAAAGDGFGSSVSLSAGTLAVGSPGEDGAGTDRGAVYLFDPSSRTEQARLEDGSANDGARMGTAVSVTAQRVAVGLPGLDAGAGAIAEFDLASRARTQLTRAGAGQLALGSAVAAGDEALVAGAPDSQSETGAVRVQRSPTLVFLADFE